MNKLSKANEYVAKNHIAKEELPVFHVTPPCGWMNDPNGFSAFQGKAHLFYQFHPYSDAWGPMHWGHCETEDFMKWTELPVALAPDQSYDAAGCFSGSGIETEQGHLLVYTGVIEKEENGEKICRQNQCIALGNGKTYVKTEGNPVVTGEMLPQAFSREHFRDPKIGKQEDGYYMVVGNKTEDGVPQVVMFSSEDLKEWKYVSVLASDEEGKYGSMWECPDFFLLDGEYVLITSPQDISAGPELHNGNNSVYYLGKYEKKTHKFHYEQVYSLDDGLDFYAPQTMQTPDGRRIMIGWMKSWDSDVRPAGQKWNGMMTLPRELRMEQGRLMQCPVREIEKYYKNSVSYERENIQGIRKLENISGRVLDMTVEITDGDYREFTVDFAQDAQHKVSFSYYKNKKMFEIDRTYSGMVRDVLSNRKVRVKSSDAKMKMRFILDKYSAEIFINDGAQVFSTTFYTPMNADGIQFVCDGSAVVNIHKHDIEVK